MYRKPLTARRFGALSVFLMLGVLCWGQTSGRGGSVEITGDVAVSQLVKKHIEFNEQMKTVPGYRVQIAALSGANSRNQAFELKNQFLSDYPEVEVYIQFSDPYFRIKAGDFTTKLEAYVFMQKIKDKYPGTIVHENVYPIHLDWSNLVPEEDEGEER